MKRAFGSGYRTRKKKHPLEEQLPLLPKVDSFFKVVDPNPLSASTSENNSLQRLVDVDCCSESSTSGPAFDQREAERLRILDEQAKRKAKSADQKIRFAKIYYNAEGYEAACLFCTKAIELCPQNPGFYSHRASCYKMLGKYQEALVDARKCMTIDPTIIKAHLIVLECSMIMGNVCEAKSAMSKALELDPNNRRLLVRQKKLGRLEKFMNKAEIALAKQNYSEVIDCLESCCKVSTSCPAFQLRKAECLIFLKKFKEAWKIADDILQMDEHNVDAMYVCGACCYYQDDIDRALEQFQQLYQLAPDYTKALDVYKKAKTLKKIKEEIYTACYMNSYEAALEYSLEALSIDPQNVQVNAGFHLSRACVYATLKDFEESIKECTKALELNESYIKALLRRAQCHTELEDFEEAVCDYKEACRINKSEDIVKLLREAERALELKCVEQDYYKILDIDRNATTNDVKKAYHEKARMHHPDKHVNASKGERGKHERKFKLIDKAYKTLSDPQDRARYDRTYD